ncbi:MAG: hypothetical protein EOM63_06830 [Clostridia bacterium]|nr:hypothetical protein [Clostridia bacterium]
MSRLKQWLCGKFLPAYCRDEMLEENERLRERVRELRQENARLQAYIEGIHDALRRQPRIHIEEVKRG